MLTCRTRGQDAARPQAIVVTRRNKTPEHLSNAELEMRLVNAWNVERAAQDGVTIAIIRRQS